MTSRPPVVLELGPHDFALATWTRDERGVGVYRIVQREIREASVAATVARQRESTS